MLNFHINVIAFAHVLDFCPRVQALRQNTFFVKRLRDLMISVSSQLHHVLKAISNLRESNIRFNNLSSSQKGIESFLIKYRFWITQHGFPTFPRQFAPYQTVRSTSCNL